MMTYFTLCNSEMNELLFNCLFVSQDFSNDNSVTLSAVQNRNDTIDKFI